MTAGETKNDPSGWTTDTLHVYVQAVIDERDKRYEQRFEAQEKATEAAIENSRTAVTKAETAIEKRLENTNEWRQAMNDRDLKLLPRQEYDRAHVDLEKRLEEYKKSMETRITNVETALVRTEGRGSGFSSGWGYLVTAIGILLAFLVYLQSTKQVTVQPTLPMQIQPQQQH